MTSKLKDLKAVFNAIEKYFPSNEDKVKECVCLFGIRQSNYSICIVNPCKECIKLGIPICGRPYCFTYKDTNNFAKKQTLTFILKRFPSVLLEEERGLL